MTYRIELRPAVVRAPKKLDPPTACRIQGAIALLAEDPRPQPPDIGATPTTAEG